jgi:hypothetical protein
MRSGYFTCGCRVAIDPERGIEDIPLCSTGDHLVCPVHGLHEYGWRSLPLIQVKVHPFDPDNPKYLLKPDYSATPSTMGFPLDHALPR